MIESILITIMLVEVFVMVALIMYLKKDED